MGRSATDTKASRLPLDCASASDASGTPDRRFSSAWSFQKKAVTIEGRLACYEATVSGQRLQRHFCPVCGSAVSITLDRYPEIRSMMAGTLDDRTRIKPTFSIWCSSGQPWLKLPDSIACYPEYPEGTFGG